MKRTSLARRIATYALLIALQIILTRFLSIQTPIVRIGFTFVPIAISAIFFGPWVAGSLAALSDVMGFVLNPVGTFHPGFIASAFLSGVIYGLFLYKQEISWLRIGLAGLVIGLAVHLGLNSLWLSQIHGQGAWGLLVARIPKEVVIFLVQVPIIYVVWKALRRTVASFLISN